MSPSGRGGSACPCLGGTLGTLGGWAVSFGSNPALGDGESRDKALGEVHPDGFISL